MRHIKKIITLVCLSITTLSFAQLNSQSSLTSAKPIGLTATIETSLHSNIDEHSIDDKAGADLVVTKTQLEMTKKIKVLKTKIKSKTNLNVDYTQLGSSYDKVELVNQDNVDTELRSISIEQKLSTSKRISKKAILVGSFELKAAKGYSIDQEFLATPEEIKYHVLADEYIKMGFDFGFAVRLAKSNTLQALYRFNDFNHSGQSSYDERQGSNDKRTNTAGVQDIQKITKNLSLYGRAQIEQTIYRDKVALSQAGFLITEGEAQASKLQNETAALGVTYYNLKTEIVTLKQIDLINDGDSYHSNLVKVSYEGKLAQWSYHLDAQFGRKTFKQQENEELSAKRVDNMSTLGLKLVYNISNKYNLSLNINNTDFESNNQYGTYTNNIAGLGFSGIF